MGLENYPAGIDGLANEGFNRYLFVLDDPIAVRTRAEALRGGYLYEQNRAKLADMLAVSGDTVALKKLRQALDDATGT